MVPEGVMSTPDADMFCAELGRVPKKIPRETRCPGNGLLPFQTLWQCGCAGLQQTSGNHWMGNPPPSPCPAPRGSAGGSLCLRSGKWRANPRRLRELGEGLCPHPGS